MSDPDTVAVARLEVALTTIARQFCDAVYARHRFRLSPDEVVGILTHAIAERDRIEADRVDEVRRLQQARTKPQKAVPRSAWRDERTPVVDPWAEEDTRPSRPRR